MIYFYCVSSREYFDLLGVHDEEVMELVLRFNREVVQSDTSNLCGQFCLYFIHCKLKGIPNKLTDTDIDKNERIVKRYFMLNKC